MTSSVRAPRSGARTRGACKMRSTPRHTRFLMAALATWRVTHLLAEEDGPADIVVRLRARAGSGPLASLMDCFYCLSVWVAVPFSVGLARPRRVSPLAWLALSGAACLLEQASATPAVRTQSHTQPEQEVPGS
jgi:hypothetical protein